MTHDYGEKLRNLVGAYSEPQEEGNTDKSVDADLAGKSLSEVYYHTFTTLQEDMVRLMQFFSQKEGILKAGARYEFRLGYDLMFDNDKCHFGPTICPEVKADDSQEVISDSILETLRKLKTKYKYPSFSEHSEDGKMRYIERGSPRVDCTIYEEMFKKYRENILDSICLNFGMMTSPFQVWSEKDNCLLELPNPARIERFIIGSYLSLEASLCKNSLWVSFEGKDYLGSVTSHRIFRSTLERRGSANEPLHRSTRSRGDPSIVYFSPQLAEKLVKHDSSDAGSLLPLGLLPLTHLCMVKKVLQDYQTSLL